MPFSPNEHRISEDYSGIEYKCVVAAHVGTVNAMILIQVCAYFFPNDYHLLFNFYVIFWPLDEFSFVWELNYFFMTVCLFFADIFFAFYFALPMVLMNHSCFLIDMALATAEQMNADLQLDEALDDPERVERTNHQMRKFIARCEKISKWKNENQKLLTWNFNFEFQVQTLMMCLSIYVLSINIFGSGFVLSLFSVCIVQLFILCWLGTRITTRLDQLAIEVSKNWHLMLPKQRQDLQMIICMTQHFKGFTGIFKEVSLETYQSVKCASFIKILKCLNQNFFDRFWRLHFQFTPCCGQLTIKYQNKSYC